jgi:hypothetical protein
MVFKQPISVIFTQKKRRWWLFECQGAKIVWDCGITKEKCHEHLVSMAFDLYDLKKSDDKSKFLGVYKHLAVLDDNAGFWADQEAEWQKQTQEWYDKIDVVVES